MALDKQFVPISFGQGIQTKDDPKQLIPGQLTVLQNGVFQVGHEIKKRNGYTALTTNIQGGGTIGAANLVQAYQSEEIELDGQNLYSYNPSTPNWVNKGQLVTTTLTTSTVIRNSTQQTIQDSAINGSLQCFVWYDSVGQIGYSIFDKTTKQSIVNNQTLSSNGTIAKVLSLGSNFVVIYFASGSLRYRTINTATPTVLSGSTSIAADANVNGLFDATVFNSRIYLAYSGSAASIGMYYLDSSLVLSSKLTVGSENADAAITVFGDASNNAWVSYGKSATVKAFIANANLSGTVAAPFTINASTTIANATGIVSGSTGTIYYEVVGTNTAAGDPNNYIKSNTAVLSGTVGTAGSPSVFNRDVGLASKVFSYGSASYFLATKTSTLQSTYFLFNNSGTVVLKLSPDSGGGYTSHAILPEVNTVSSGVYQTASLVKDLLIATSGTLSTQTGVLSATMNMSAASPPNIVLGQNSLIGGGIINMYDGANVVEHGYNIYPEGLSTTISSGSGGMGASATNAINSYQYSAVYEWTDNQGQIHKSAPSVPVTLQAPINQVFIVTGNTNGDGGTPANHFGTVITAISNAGNYSPNTSPSGTWFMNIIGHSNGGFGVPWLNWTYNTHITSASGTSATVADQYNIVSGSNSFIISSYPVGVYTGPHGHGAAITAGNGAFSTGQIILPADGTSIYPDGTYVTSIGTDGTNLVLSQPSLGTQFSAGYASFYYSPQTFSTTVSVPTLRITEKQKVSIVLYRTENDGTIFYRVTSPTSPTYNDKTVDAVSIVDSHSDKDIIGNEQLYTTGGELENIEAPAVNVMQTYKSRAIVVPSESSLSWWFSKQVLPGSPIEFSDSFVENVDAKIGAITAVGVLDEKLILFGATSKYLVAGNGPAASGVDNDFSEAQHITGSTGCSNQNSIIEIPVGLIYQDPTKGIYLLDRSLSEVYIGQEVEQYNSDPVTSTQLIPGTTSLRMTLTSGTVLIYDWFFRQWGNDPYLAEAVSSSLFGGKFTYAQANGLVLQESSGTYTDNGTYYALAPTTGWMSFAGVQGFQRVYQLILLGNYKSPHDLNIQIYTDFNDTTPSQTVLIPVQTDPGKYEFRIRLQKQKCTAIKIKIFDSNQSGTGESYSLSSMGFEVGIKKGANKLAAAQSY